MLLTLLQLKLKKRRKLLQRLLQRLLLLRTLTFQTSVLTKLKLLKSWLRLVTRLKLNNL
ncbi:hypothetical protein W824_09785 [Clavibacter cf. michiganensis LMG 26808]|nr:hypothetical protein W824_09785 [Clavibacter cf. michiganensis LMG 26808]